MKPKVNRRKEIIKIRGEINDKKNPAEQINESRSLFCERINKIEKNSSQTYQTGKRKSQMREEKSRAPQENKQL